MMSIPVYRFIASVCSEYFVNFFKRLQAFPKKRFQAGGAKRGFSIVMNDVGTRLFINCRLSFRMHLYKTSLNDSIFVLKKFVSNPSLSGK